MSNIAVPESWGIGSNGDAVLNNKKALLGRLFLYGEPPPLCGGFQKAYSFAHVSKTPFDLLKSLAVWQLRVNKSKGGHDG